MRTSALARPRPDPTVRPPAARAPRRCNLSHAVLWHACAARGDDAPPMLILEDDVLLTRGFATRVNKARRRLCVAEHAPSRNTTPRKQNARVSWSHQGFISTDVAVPWE